MRDTFIKTLIEEAKTNTRIELVTGDLGFGIFNEYKTLFPDRFTNAGIAEQNMISMCSGMAMMGKIVVAYSIGNFATLRALEQIRNDACYHNANVKIVSSGGFTYGPLGVSHHSTEDVSTFRAIPNMSILTPSDKNEAVACTKYMLSKRGPFYLRTERGGQSLLDGDEIDVTKPRVINTFGSDELLLSYGSISQEVKKVSNDLKIDMATMPMVKPLYYKNVLDLILKYKTIYVVEENNVIGGLGSAICDLVCKNGLSIRVHTLGMQDIYSTLIGSQDYQRKSFGIDADGIKAYILKQR